MMKVNVGTIIGLCLAISVLGCSPTSSQLKKALEEDPSILYNAIEKNPKDFMAVLNKAANEAQRQMAEERQEEEQKIVEADFKNPKNPEIPENRAIFGNKDAPITIVEYSSFYCPYCADAASTLEEIKAAYGDKVRILYKHLLYSGNDEPAARYFEAIAKQSVSKAKKFHDLLFQNQKKVFEDEGFLDEAAKKAKADLKQIAKIKNSDEITQILATDKAEGKKMGFTGSPGFIINGVRIRGAYPLDHFKSIIDRHLSQMGLSTNKKIGKLKTNDPAY